MVESSDQIKAIGGYFGLADCEDECELPIENGILLNTGRNALEYILTYIPNIKKIYLPVFTCEVVLEPLIRNNIIYDFYSINKDLEIKDDIVLKEDEYIIANNYFGIKDKYIEDLSRKFNGHLIIDNAQALFAPVLPNIKAFYSARKFVGVADGGFAVGVESKGVSYFKEDDSSLHNSHLIIRRDFGAEAGFKYYQQNETKLDNQPIKGMCRNTRDILCHINYDRVKAIRRKNFEFLHNALGKSNQLNIPQANSFVCPMVYPYYSNQGCELRDRLIKNKIFVARYWPNVLDWCAKDSLEYKLADNTIAIPIDQRYGEIEMKRIIETINN